MPGFSENSSQLLEAEGLAVVIGAFVATSSSITNNSIQDLQTGKLIGATPWKQQLILILAVIVSALVLAPILELLFNAYGLAGISPPGHFIEPSETLSAPQATLMATLVVGAFHHNVPWGLISAGFVVALVCILVDKFLRSRGMRLPVMAVGLGIYLPLETSCALILGGMTSYLVERTLRKKYPQQHEDSADKPARQRGLTLASGLVAGTCIMGAVLAVPFILAQSTEALRLMPEYLGWVVNLYRFV